MKQILDLARNFIEKDEESIDFINNQFLESHFSKNVLFVSPKINGRSFYKFIMPYCLLYEYDQMGTAIIGIDKYNPNNEYQFTNIPLYSKQILWADFIVFPFCKQNLAPLYDMMRCINPSVKIVFNVDFNYYLLGTNHPLKKQFSNEEIIGFIEDNIFYSDICLTTNNNLSEYLVAKFEKELNESKYKDIESNVEIATIPLLIDEDLVLENLDSEEKFKTPESNENSEQSETPQETVNAENEAETIKTDDKKSFRVGIVASNYTWQDLNSYKEQFKEAKEKFGDNITFVMIGFDGIDLNTKKSCFTSDFTFEYVKPCSIIHYYKQLKELNLDLMFIPLIKNEFNETSENYNKLLEASLFNIPVMVLDTFPYNRIITDMENGVLIKGKKDFVLKLDFCISNQEKLKQIGVSSNNFIKQNFSYNEKTITIFEDIFS